MPISPPKPLNGKRTLSRASSRLGPQSSCAWSAQTSPMPRLPQSGADAAMYRPTTFGCELQRIRVFERFHGAESAQPTGTPCSHTAALSLTGKQTHAPLNTLALAQGIPLKTLA